MTERRDGHSKLVYDKEAQAIKTVDPHPVLQHTHRFEEVLSRDDGLTRRCQCGARLWEPEPRQQSRIAYCANGHRCTIPSDAFSDGVGASHACPICGLGVPKERTGDQHGARAVTPQQMYDHAALIRKMDKIANSGGPVQTMEPTARILDAAADALIADIAEGSGTLNSLPHIAKIARGTSSATPEPDGSRDPFASPDRLIHKELADMLKGSTVGIQRGASLDVLRSDQVEMIVSALDLVAAKAEEKRP